MFSQRYIDSLWQHEIINTAFQHQHLICEDAIYFKVGNDIMVSRRRFEGGYEDPEVVNDPKLIRKVYPALSCLETTMPARRHAYIQA